MQLARYVIQRLCRRPDPALKRTMTRREKIRRGRLAGEEDAITHRACEFCAVVVMAGQGVGVGAVGERVALPGRHCKGPQLSAIVGSEQRDDLVDGNIGECAFAGGFQLARKAAAEIAFDGRKTLRTQVIAAGADFCRRAAQMAVLDSCDP